MFEKILQQGVLAVLSQETGKGELGCVSERFAGPVVIEYGWMDECVEMWNCSFCRKWI